MKTITLDLTTPEGRAAAHAALRGRQQPPGSTRVPRKARGEGTMSRTSALNELAAAGWLIYSYNGGYHTYQHADGRVVKAESYDELLDMLLREVRGK
jgi:hypothetical protein